MKLTKAQREALVTACGPRQLHFGGGGHIVADPRVIRALIKLGCATPHRGISSLATGWRDAEQAWITKNGADAVGLQPQNPWGPLK